MDEIDIQSLPLAFGKILGLCFIFVSTNIYITPSLSAAFYWVLVNKTYMNIPSWNLYPGEGTKILLNEEGYAN